MGKGWGWRHAGVGLALTLLAGCAHAVGTPLANGPDENGALADPGTGATQKIAMGRNDPTRFSTMEEFLQGRVAGLQVIPLGGGQFDLRIRGTSSVNMSTQPLVVIDGVQLSPEGISNALATVTPGQVKSVEVLKDAASTAIYGLRGANGVIIIRTKRRPDD